MNIDFDLIERTLREETELQAAIELALKKPEVIELAPLPRIVDLSTRQM